MLIINNDRYIGLKLLCVFSVGCIGSAQMFLPIFYKKELNLGADKIGFMYSITPLVSFLALPYWTSLIDKSGHYKKIMITNMFISLLSILFIGIVPYLADTEWPRIILASIGCFGYAFFGYPIIVAIVDSLIFKILGDQKDLFGRQKIGTPIGFALAIFMTGVLSDKLDSSYALFIVYALSNIAFMITVYLIHIPASYQKILTEEETSDYGSTSTEELDVSIWELLKDPSSIQFFTYMAFSGFCIAVIQAFLYLFIENDLHGTPALIGLFGPLGSTTEVICFYFSKQLIQKLGGRKMLIISQCILIYRCLTYIICTKISFGPQLATVTQLLHGVGYSILWSAAALQANELAPDHLKNTAQGLLNMAYNGIGSGLGAIVAGYIYENWGSVWMWFTVIITCLFSIFLYSSTFIRNVLFLRLSDTVKKYID